MNETEHPLFISEISIGEVDIMKAAVIGGVGFIGSNLCERLVDEGHQVFCLDNFSLGNEANIKNLNGNVGM